MSKLLFILLIIPLLLFMQSCTGMIVYLVEAEIVSSTESDFKLDQKQSLWVKEKVHYHMTALRTGFIHGFIDIVEDGNEAYQDKLTVAELDQIVNRTRDHVKQYASSIFQDIGEFFALISPEQYAYYKKYHDHDEADFDLDFDDNQDIANTKENVIKKYRKMYGKLESSQIKLISKLYEENPSSFEHDLRISFEKSTFTKSIAMILKNDLSPKQEKQSWIELFSNPDKIFESLAFDAVFESIKLNQRKFVEIDSAMNKDQRQHFSSKISHLSEKVKFLL